MSIRIMSQIFDRYHVGGSEMLLALALADHASDDGTRVFPTVASLAAKTRQSERTVQYQLRRMEESGWLVLVSPGSGGRGSAGRAAEYQISPEWIKGANIAPIKKGATQRIKGCNPAQEMVQLVAPQSSVTIIEPSERKTPLRKIEYWAGVLPDWAPVVAWQGFIEMRVKAKKPVMTQRAAELLVKKLDEFRAAGFSPEQVLEQSTMNGWQGLFEPKRGTAKPAPQPAPICEFRGKQFDPRAEACGMPDAVQTPHYGGKKLCPHHRREIEDIKRTQMPEEVRRLLKLTKRVAA